jgi:hypothetical protein
MRGFRRLAVGFVAAVGLLGGLAAPAAAEDLQVTGSYTGTGIIVTEPCGGMIGVVADGSGDWTGLGSTTFRMGFCDAFPVDTIFLGSFTVTTADGSVTGVLTGEVQAFGPGPEFPFHLVMDLGSGTGSGRFTGATGQLVLDGAFGLGAATFHGTVAGTIHIPPPTPATRDDCKNGGWRNLGDEAGTPFRNQGDCVAWAIHHL